MTTQLHDPTQEKDLSKLVNPKKEGLFYDDCPDPGCGNRDVEIQFKSGGVTQRSQERYHDFSIFHCTCCGSNWTRDSKQYAAEKEAKGLAPAKAVESSAMVSRTVFMMGSSPRYRANYDRIDWSK